MLRMMKRTTVLGTLFATALSLPAFARDVSLSDNSMLVVTPEGKATLVKIKETPMTDLAMKNSRMAPGAVILMKHAGKLYVVDDVKLDNGETLSRRVLNWQHPGGTGGAR
jgi:hypothetical protein